MEQIVAMSNESRIGVGIGTFMFFHFMELAKEKGMSKLISDKAWEGGGRGGGQDGQEKERGAGKLYKS